MKIKDISLLRRNWVPGKIIVGIWAVSVNIFFFPRLDVDTFHDGVLYPMALMSSQGASANIDYVSWYGPLTPFLQGLWLKALGQNLIALRLHGACLVLLISYLLYKILLRFLKTSTAFYLTIIWTIGNPLILHPNLPWPDLYLTLLVLILMQVINGNSNWKFLNNISFLLTGFLLAMGLLFKINFILTILCLLVVLILKKKHYELLQLLLGFGFFVAFALIFMITKGYFTLYFQQVILWALDNRLSEYPLRGIINIRVLLFGCIYLSLLVLFNKKCLQMVVNRPKVLSIVGAITSILFAVIAYLFRDLESNFTALNDNLISNLLNLLKNLPYSVMFASLFLSVISFFHTVKPDKMNKNKDVDYLWTKIISGSYLSILFPSPETAHIWFVYPVAIVGAASIVNNFLAIETQKVFKSIILVPTTWALIIINFQYINLPRLEHKEIPVQGMYSKLQNYEPIEQTLSLLASANIEGAIEYRCPRGIYSVFNNSFRASDNQFVDLIPRLQIQRKRASIIFECDITREKLNEIVGEYTVIFQRKGETSGNYNILYIIDSKSNDG